MVRDTKSKADIEHVNALKTANSSRKKTLLESKIQSARRGGLITTGISASIIVASLLKADNPEVIIMVSTSFLFFGLYLLYKAYSAEKLLKNSTVNRENQDVSNQEIVPEKVSDQTEESDLSLDEDDRPKVVKKEKDSPGLSVGLFLLIAAAKSGLFQGDLSAGELGYVFGTLAGLHFGTTFMWKQFGTIVGLISLAGALMVVLKMNV